jgi:hypothetical protein
VTRLFAVLPRRAAALALTAGLAAGLLTGCNSASPAAPAPSAAPLLPQSARFTNRDLAVREIRRLVVLPHLPPARNPLFAAPDNLLAPQSVPSGGSLVDTKRFWRVRMGIADARRWIAAHPPTGLRAAGTSSGVMFGAPTVYGFHYADEDSAAWTSASLQIAVVAGPPGVTYWRVDAMAVWLDSMPARVPAGGHRLSFTVESGCPSSDGGAVSVPPSDLRNALLPSGRPAEALVCRYSGAGTLTSHTRLLAPAAGRLADLAGEVTFGHVDRQVINCPMDGGSHLAIGFGYPDGQIGALWYRASGCPAVDNGTVFAGVGPGSTALLAALARLR